MDECNTFKAIIFCLDKHEIYPRGNNRTAGGIFKEVAQCAVKDLHTSPQTASGFYLCMIHSSHMATEDNILDCTELHASHLSK